MSVESGDVARLLRREHQEVLRVGKRGGDMTQEEVAQVVEHIANGHIIGYLNQLAFHEQAQRQEIEQLKARLAAREKERA